MALLVQPSKLPHNTAAAPGTTNKARWSLYGHDEEVLTVAARGTVFSSSSADGVTLLWRLNHDGVAENVCKVQSRGPAVLDSKFLTAGTLLCAQGDGCVRLWNVERGAELESTSRGAVRGRNPWPVMNTIAVSSETRYFCGGDDGYLAQCDHRQGTTQTTWANLKVPITSSCCTNDSLFVGDVCGRVHWFDLRMTGASVDCLACSKDVVTSLNPDARGEHVAALSLDGTLRLLDVQPFATSSAERCLATMSVSQDAERRNLLRADWNWADDIMAVPASDGHVHSIAPSRHTGEVVFQADTRFEDPTNVVNAVTFVSRNHILIAGTSTLVLQEV